MTMAQERIVLSGMAASEAVKNRFDPLDAEKKISLLLALVGVLFFMIGVGLLWFK